MSNSLPDPDLPAHWPADAIESVRSLRTRLERQLKISRVLTERVEREMDSQTGGFTLFQTAILLEGKVNERTTQLAHVNEALQREVAEHERAADMLREAHAQTQLLLQSMPAILIELDGNDAVTEWNAAAETAFRLHREEVIGRPLSACSIHWDWRRVGDGLARSRASAQLVSDSDLPFRRVDGSDGFLRVRISPVVGSARHTSSVLLIGEDITEWRSLQIQLVQAQKLTAIGELAAGIAHEINTPTQYVGDNALFLKGAFESLLGLVAAFKATLPALESGVVPSLLIDTVQASLRETDLDYLMEEIPAAISQTLEGVERVTKIVRAMKEFSHPDSNEKSMVDLNKAIESTLIVARSEWKYVANLVTDFDPELPPVPCLAGELNQVVLNVVINAAHAIAEGGTAGAEGKGTITVSTRREDGWAEVRISDTGAGIPDAIRDRIFDPFFTTKEVGKGTGQGLAISHQVVVTKHGGSINFESEVGRGTTFIVRLPLASDARAERKAA